MKTILLNLLAACLVDSIWVADAQFVQAHPIDGQSVSYVDIDSKGRVLEIDYANCAASTLTELKLPLEQIADFGNAYVAKAHECVYLFMLAPQQKISVKVASLSNGIISEVGIEFDLNTDWSFYSMLGREYLRYYDRDSGAEKWHTIKGEAAREIKAAIPEPGLIVDSDGHYAYRAPRLGDTIAMIDLKGKNDEQHIRISRILGPAFETVKTYILACELPYILVGANPDIVKPDIVNTIFQRQLFLIRVPECEIAAQSDRTPLPFFTNPIMHCKNGNAHILAIGREQTLQSFVPTGKYMEIAQNGEKLEKGPVHDYDPAKEVVLRSSSGAWEKYPRYRLDYVSLLDLARNIDEGMVPPHSSLVELEEFVRTRTGNSIPTRSLRINSPSG